MYMRPYLHCLPFAKQSFAAVLQRPPVIVENPLCLVLRSIHPGFALIEKVQVNFFLNLERFPKLTRNIQWAIEQDKTIVYCIYCIPILDNTVQLCSTYSNKSIFKNTTY